MCGKQVADLIQMLALITPKTVASRSGRIVGILLLKGPSCIFSLVRAFRSRYESASDHFQPALPSVTDFSSPTSAWHTPIPQQTWTPKWNKRDRSRSRSRDDYE